MVCCDSCGQYCWALLFWSFFWRWAVLLSTRWGWRQTSVMLPKTSPFHTPTLFPEWHRWVFRLFSNVAWFLTWKVSCQLSICLPGVTMLICLQLLKSEVIVVYPDKCCHCNGSLQKKKRDNSLQVHFYTNTHTYMHKFVCIHAQLENIKSPLKCKS